MKEAPLRSRGASKIKEMPRTTFKTLVKEKINKCSLKYLQEIRKSKGKEIEYLNLKMAEYLQPSSDCSIEVKQRIFSIRNRMVKIPDNFKQAKPNKHYDTTPRLDLSI